MSRNLGQTNCYYCRERVLLVGSLRRITEQDCGSHYFNEYRGMIVSDAECPVCGAQYLAWVTPPSHWGRCIPADPEIGFCDLSFRSSFNDEPGDADLPKWRIEWLPMRIPWGQTGPAVNPLDELHSDLLRMAEDASADSDCRCYETDFLRLAERVAALK